MKKLCELLNSDFSQQVLIMINSGSSIHGLHVAQGAVNWLSGD